MTRRRCSDGQVFESRTRKDRVALCVVVQPLTWPLSSGGIAVVTTHLTFAHHEYDERARQLQIDACLRAVQAGLTKWRPTQRVPILIAGDLNGGGDDQVARALRNAGFVRAFDECHGRPVRTTHVDHRGRPHAADHMWYNEPAGAEVALRLGEVSLLPRGTIDSARLSRPVLEWNKRRQPSRAPPASLSEWCQISDHRPLVASFRIEVP